MNTTTLSRLTALLLAAACFLPLSSASAGGYDTPMLYSARHMGMGGTAVAYVDDPSAMFHNPAGLMGTERLTLMGDFSLLLGNITGNPAESDQDVKSNMTVGPFFLAGMSARLTENVALGFAVYPVASASASYTYGAEDRLDSTTLFFLELSPGIAFQIPNTNLSIGIGYRMTYVSLDRQRDQSMDFGLFENSGPDFQINGWSFAGVRFGMQYQLFERFSLGLSYRHKTTTDVDGPGTLSSALGEMESDEVTGRFILPSRLSFGFRGDVGAFGFAVDAEYAFQSQNEDGAIEGFVLPITQVSRWQDSWTIRLGAEYRLLNGRLPIRAGFIWDQRTSNPQYPSAFGTPPAPTYTGTLGAGFNVGRWQANLAAAFRYGQTTVTAEDIAGRDSCSSCSFAGEASIRLGGVYLDFSYHFGRGETTETGSGVSYGGSNPLLGASAAERRAEEAEREAEEAEAAAAAAAAEAQAAEADAQDAESEAVSAADEALDAEADAVDAEAEAAEAEAEARRERLQAQAAEAEANTAAAAAAASEAAAAAAEAAAEEEEDGE